MNKIINTIDLNNLEKIYKSNGYNEFKIIKDLGMSNGIHYVNIQFINTNFISKVALSQVKYGSVRDKSIIRINQNINPDILHKSKYGPYRIIKDNGFGKSGKRTVLIKFENTGSLKICDFQSAINGNVKDDKYSDLDFNILYDTYKSGKFKLLEYIGNKIYKIKFIDTGSELCVRKDHIKDGHIQDPALLRKINVGEIYKSTKCGDIIVKEILNNNYALIEFINTNYNKICRIDHILNGNVRDDTIPSVYGVANYGNIDKNYIEVKKIYNIWNNMISRCYNIKDKSYKSYGQKGVSVCERWLLFENFLDDIKYLKNYDKLLQYPDIYELDKDFLQQGIPIQNRIYSPETCMFITKSDNLNLSANERNNKITVCKNV